jgi:hypothetical protein
VERGELRPGPALQQEHPSGRLVVDDDGGDEQRVGVQRGRQRGNSHPGDCVTRRRPDASAAPARPPLGRPGAGWPPRERLGVRRPGLRVLLRDDPLAAWFVVDHAALCRLVGSAEVMAGQVRQLAVVAELIVTVQVLAAVGHPATLSGFMVTEDSAYAEHVGGGLIAAWLSSPTGSRRDRLPHRRR